MRNARRHLPHKSQPFALRQFPLQPQLVFNQPAQIQRPRQLLAQKFQRHFRLSGNRRPVRLDAKRSHGLVPLQDREAFFEFLAGRMPLHLSAIRIPERQSHLRKLKLFLEEPFNKFCELRHIAPPRLLVDFGRQAMRHIHLLLRGLLKSPPQRSLQRFDENHQHEEQDGSRRLGRQNRFEPKAETADQAEVKQSQESGRNRVQQVLLPPDLQEVMPIHKKDQHAEWQDREQRKGCCKFPRPSRFQMKRNQMQSGDRQKRRRENCQQRPVEIALRRVRGGRRESPFPNSAPCQRDRQHNRKAIA